MLDLSHGANVVYLNTSHLAGEGVVGGMEEMIQSKGSYISAVELL